MLQDIRENSQGTVAKIIIGLIVVTFSLWGIDSIVGSFGGEPEVAAVNGEPITERLYQRTLTIKRQQILAQMGDAADPASLDEALIAKSVLDSMIDTEMLYQDAESKDLMVSDAAIDQMIRSWPQVQRDGKFDPELFTSLVRNQLGMSVPEFRTEMAKQTAINAIRGAVMTSQFVLPSDTALLMRLDRQARDFDLTTFKVADFVEQAQVSDVEISEYYDEHESNFVTPESVDVAYLELSVDKLATSVTVDSGEVASRYEQLAAEMRGQEERDASHILVEQGDLSDAVLAERLAEVQAAIDSGTPFSELAAKYSDDFGSKKSGGELGFAGKGVYAPEFEAQLYAMNVGEVKGPVKTSFGNHFIKLNAVREAPMAELAEMAPAIEDTLRREKAQKLFAEQVGRLADVTYGASDLQEPADEFGLEIVTASGITRNEKEGDFAKPGFIKQIFRDDVLKEGANTELIEIEKDRVWVARVASYHESARKPLDAVAVEIRDLLRIDKAKQAAAERGQALLSELQSGNVASAVSWTPMSGIRRVENGVSPSLLKAVFAAERPANGGVLISTVTEEGDFVIARVTKVDDAVSTLTETETSALGDFIRSQEASALYRLYQQAVRDASEITRI